VETIDLLVFYEHVARELDALCAVKYLCETRHGLRVEIAHQPYGVPEALQRWQPRVVAVPFCYSDSLRHYPFLLDWPQATIFNLAWEQLFYEGNRSAKLPQGEFECRQVLHQAWGEFFVETLQRQGVPRASIFQNGQPAYMLYGEPYRRYFVSRAQLAERHGIDPAKRWVFFPENYNWAFYAGWKLDEWVATGIPRERIEAMVAFCRESFAQVVAWCQAIAAQGTVEIIIRPRPATPASEFTAAVERAIPGQAPALRIIKDETVREWILASDVVVSSYSTSLIEAAVAGKPNFMLEPVPVIEALRVDWQDHAARLRTQAEFEAACLGQPAATLDDRLGQWARRHMLAGGDALSNLADHLAGLVRHPPRPQGAQRRRWLAPQHPWWMPAWLAFERERRQGASLRRTPRPAAALYEQDVVSPADIAARTQRWRAVLGAAPAAAGAEQARQPALRGAA
jgi:surface carbohydrate biosynthesis protein